MLIGMPIGLDCLARLQGHIRTPCLLEAIRQILLRHGDIGSSRRQSQHLARLEPPTLSAQLPGWSVSTARRLLLLTSLCPWPDDPLCAPPQALWHLERGNVRRT